MGFEIGDCLLYITDFPSSTTLKDLKDIFSEYGVIVCSDIVIKPSGNFAFIQFDNPESAQTALDELNYLTINGDPISIAVVTKEIVQSICKCDSCISINGVGDADPDQIHELLSNFGTVLSVKRSADHDAEGVGSACVQFMSIEDAEKATEALNGSSLEDQPLSISKFIRTDKPLKPNLVRHLKEVNQFYRTIFVRNLPPSINNASKFLALSINYGDIVGYKFFSNKGGGLIEFADHESAVKAVSELNGREIADKKLIVTRAPTLEEKIAYSMMHNVTNK